MVWLLFETSRNLRTFATQAKWPFFDILGGISKKCSRQCKSGGFMAKFGQELKCGILIKIRMVWLLFETSRNLRKQAKYSFFSIFWGISKKSFRQCKSGGFMAKIGQEL